MMFTAYLGGLPEDVVLAAVRLNGEEYMLPFANTSSHRITQVTYANNTQGYTLKVPFGHPAVVKKVNHPPAHSSGSCAAVWSVFLLHSWSKRKHFSSTFFQSYTFWLYYLKTRLITTRQPSQQSSLLSVSDFLHLIHQWWADVLIVSHSPSRHWCFLFGLWNPLHCGAPAFQLPVADHNRLGSLDIRTGNPAWLHHEQRQPEPAAGRAALHSRLQVQREEPAPENMISLNKDHWQGCFTERYSERILWHIWDLCTTSWSLRGPQILYQDMSLQPLWIHL